MISESDENEVDKESAHLRGPDISKCLGDDSSPAKLIQRLHIVDIGLHGRNRLTGSIR